ncbi:hypothetical protein DANDELION_88 [Mycobacterium phage Dandelion]|uniref:Uncharacterized protein n=1 Tax=Mycobacterium phage Dandelion TaxID=1074305 RepID=G1JW40_9CAUD|nr:hypothetical protein DANDELION_88 [Mycobacterium phage Dandelion]AEL97758.1 hypothetical protein DANDELION_88 [Mycobacterium phage Dandelion]
MFRRKSDGTYALSARFWTYAVIAALIIVWIGIRTQRTANLQEEQARNTTEFAAATNRCLNQVIDVLTTRVGYNDQIAELDRRWSVLDARRQAIWDQLVFDLAQANNSDGLNKQALDRFLTSNAQLKDEIGAIRSEQAKLGERREEVQYPDCAAALAVDGPGK